MAVQMHKRQGQAISMAHHLDCFILREPRYRAALEEVQPGLLLTTLPDDSFASLHQTCKQGHQNLA